jgi:hypothetical protein
LVSTSSNTIQDGISHASRYCAPGSRRARQTAGAAIPASAAPGQNVTQNSSR